MKGDRSSQPVEQRMPGLVLVDKPPFTELLCNLPDARGYFVPGLVAIRPSGDRLHDFREALHLAEYRPFPGSGGAGERFLIPSGGNTVAAGWVISATGLGR